MVDINPINPQSVTITTPSTNTVNLSTISNGTQNANTNADAQLAYAWACGNGLIQGIDYSSKHYAQLAKVSEDIASSAIANIEEIEQQALDSITTGIGEIETAKEGALSLIDTTKDDAIEDVEDAESTALTNINTTTQTRITEIENTASDFEADLTLLTQRAETAATSAESSAINANSSATSADTSATAAATSATNASNSESNAQDSATAAATSASNANQSAISASNSASDAAISASSASTSATNASNYATSSSTSATSAANSASAALISETNAANSANDASDYADNASASATSASTSASNAATSESNASTYASNAYSFASSASLSATNAGNSASSASQSETNAQSYMNSANTYASNASTSATNAATSETNASNSAIAAATSEDNAEIWAEGTDEQVQALGGVHSSKRWSEISASGQINSDWAETDITSKAYILNKPTNYVTTDTVQNISGRKTFLGEKAIYFKQNVASDRLGFTLYNTSNTELAALEYRPYTISSDSLLALNCPQITHGYVGFRYWGNPAVNIVAPKVATAGNYFIPTHITDGTNTVTANNKGTLNISTLLPDVSNFVTNSSLATTLADYQPLLVSGTNIKTINNNSILGSGNLTLDGLPSQTGQAGKFLTTDGTDASWATVSIPTVDQTFDGTSVNAQSGVAIAGAKFIQNTASGTNSLTIGGSSNAGIYGLNIGYYSHATTNSTAIGTTTTASYPYSTALGTEAQATAYSAIQIGKGTNSTQNTLNVGFSLANTNYQLLDGTTGLIPDARISTNIARNSDVADTTLSNVSSIDSNSAVQTALDGKVAKSGDTMTGELIIERNASPNIITRHTDFVKGTTPSEYLYWEFRPEDGNTNPSTWYENRVGNFVTQIDPSGTVRSDMIAMKNDPNSNASAGIWVQMTQAGVASCGFSNTICCDGQWHNVNTNIINKAVSLNGSSSLPYTLNLPNDGKIYECIIAAEIVTGSTSGNFLQAKVGSDICSAVTMCKARTRTASAVYGSGNALIYVSSSHNIYISRNTSWNGNLESLILIGYRRIGTNS